MKGSDILKAILSILSLLVSLASFGQTPPLLPLQDEKIYLHLDKPLYEAGDDIWFRVYLRDGNTLKASGKSEIVYVELIAPDGSVHTKAKYMARNGKCYGDLRLLPNSLGGIYKLKAYTRWMRNYGDKYFFERDLIVQKVSYPKLLMSIEFDRKAYGAGEQVNAFLKIEKTDKSPLYTFAKYNLYAGGKLIKTDTVETNYEGKAIISFKLPEQLNTEDALLHVMAENDGYTESISRSVPVVLGNISLSFFPEGGYSVIDKPCRIAFKALNQNGKAADVEGKIVDEAGTEICGFKSYHNGMGVISLAPKSGKKYFAVIDKIGGDEKKFELPAALEQGFSMRVDQNYKNKVHVKISGYGDNVTIALRLRDQLLHTSVLKMENGNAETDILVDQFSPGVAQITLFDQKNLPRCERLIFLNRNRQLKISVKPAKEKYQPREEVELKIKITDENNKPVKGELSLAVVDDKVVSYADDKQDNILSSLLLNSELQGKVEEASWYFKDGETKSDTALDLLMMTQGWRRFTWKQMRDGSAQKQLLEFPWGAEKVTIRGIAAVDSAGNRAVGAKVRLLNRSDSAITDKEGHFELKNFDPNDTKFLEIKSREGYTRYYYLENFTGDYAVEKKVSGRFLDMRSGNPVQNVHVFYRSTAIETQSDESGNFELSLCPEKDPMLMMYHPLYGLKMLGRILNDSLIWIEKSGNSSPDKVNLAQNTMEYQDLTSKTDVINNSRYYRDKLIKHCLEANACKKEMIYYTSGLADEAKKVSYVSEYPEYPGGVEELRKFIYKNICYPKNAIMSHQDNEITVGFWITKNGSVENISLLNGNGSEMAQEAKRLTKMMPRWRPARNDGKAVDYPATIKVKFSFGGDNSDQPFKIYISEQKASSDIQAFAVSREFEWPVYAEKREYETRNDYRKTLYWNPKIQTNEAGEATCRYFNSEEISRFRIITEGMDASGKIGRAEQTYITQLPFSVDARIPVFLSFSDQVDIPVTISNNTKSAQIVSLYFSASGSLRDNYFSGRSVQVPPGSKKTEHFKMNVAGAHAGKGEISISASNSSYRDNISLTTEVVPNGFPVTKNISADSLNSRARINSSDAIKGTLKARLTAYPNIIGELMSGVEAMICEPHGCFEQTSSTTYPNILAMQLMKETGHSDPGIMKKANQYIELGYKKLEGYETKEQGFEWFGGMPHHPALTAYGLMEFKDMQRVYASVDNSLIHRTEKRIIADYDGKEFKKDARGQFSHVQEGNVWDFYITYALSEAKVKGIENQLSQCYEKARETEDAYLLALAANVLLNEKREGEASQILKRLKSVIKELHFGKLPARTSITGSGDHGLQVETAALSLMALLKENKKDMKLIQEGILFINKSRSGSYFGSTQATVLALKALSSWSKIKNRSGDNDGYISLNVNGKNLAYEYFETNSLEPLRVDINPVELESLFLKSGAANKYEVALTKTEEGIPYEFNLSWYSNMPASSGRCKVAVSTELSASHVKQGETLRLNISLRNKHNEDLPSCMVKVGIPGGCSVQAWQLKELQEKKAFNYYEIKDNYVYFYYTGMKSNEETKLSLDLKADFKGSYLAPASCAYLYYTPEHKNWQSGVKVEIE